MSSNSELKVTELVAGNALPVWALPFDGGSCGPNLEYDNAFLDLHNIAQGKPETQFESAQAPDWMAVERAALALLEKSRDLRVAALLTQARLKTQGLAALPEGLLGLAHLLEHAWENVNPPLDEDDPYARLNVIEGLGAGGAFFQALRACLVLKTLGLGEIRFKDFEALLGSGGLQAPSYSRDQLDHFLRSPECDLVGLHTLGNNCQHALERLLSVLSHRVEANQVPQLVELKASIHYFKMALPQVEEPQCAKEPAEEPRTSVAETTRAGSLLGSTSLQQGIHSRAQALAAIDQICRYLEHAEPSNPAQLLLKRARRLIDKNFMQLMKDLAPGALAEVAKIMGVNPDSFEQEDV